MDFIRKSWNSKLPSTEFQQLFSEQKDQLLVIIKLLDLIGHFSGDEKSDFDDIFFYDLDKTHLFILYEYLFVSLITSPQLFINYIIDHTLDIQSSQSSINQNLNKLGLVRFISQFGNKLFEYYNISDFKFDIKNYSFCCLTVLQICLSFGFKQYSIVDSDFTVNDKNYLNSYEFNISQIALSNLSSSLHFNIMIAYSRLYYKNEIISTRKILKKRISLLSHKLQFSFESTDKDDDDEDFINYFEEEEDYVNINENDKSEIFLTLNGMNTWRHLKYVIFSNKPFITSKMSLLPRCEVMLYVISDLQVIHNSPSIFEYENIENLYGIYMHTISQFFSTPSLYLAYMITTYLVQYIWYAEKKSLKSATDTEKLGSYSAEKFHEIFSHIKKSSQPKILRNRSSSDPRNQKDEEKMSKLSQLSCFHLTAFDGQINERCGVFDYISNYDDLESFFSEIPNNGETANKLIETIYDSIFQYPAFSSLAISTFLEMIGRDDFVGCANLSRQILQSSSHLQDFRIFIYKRGNFFVFIMQLFHMTTMITDEEIFYPIWMLALSLLRFTWGSGTVGIYERFIIFIDAVEPLPLRYFLRILLQIEPQKEDLLESREIEYIIDEKSDNSNNSDDLIGFSKFYPFYVAARSLKYLLQGKIKLDYFCNLIVDHPYLWPTALLYSYSVPTPQNRLILIKVKQPNEELIKLLFKQVMLRMMDNESKKWFAASEMNDLMIMRENPPNFPGEIIGIISDQIKMFTMPITLRFSKIIGVSNIWLALAEHFGFEIFTHILLHEILKIMDNMDGYNGFDSFDVKPSIFFSNSKLTNFTNSIGHVFSVFINYQNGQLMKLIKMFIDIANNESDFFVKSDIACSYAQFVLIVINDTKENWKEAFKIIVEKCKATLQESCSVDQKKRVKLALSFIRVSLIVPKLRDILIKDDLIIQALIDMNEFSTIIDFLIAKDISTNNQSV